MTPVLPASGDEQGKRPAVDGTAGRVHAAQPYLVHFTCSATCRMIVCHADELRSQQPKQNCELQMHEEWAQRYAERPGVTVVESVYEVLAIVDELLHPPVQLSLR